jgi:LytS/YehU family sensor histidine kinase
LESSITGNVLLSEEIALVSMYLELETLRFNDNFIYNIEVDSALDTHSLEMPTMILQPLIENAVLHGLMPKNGNRNLHILFHLNNEDIEIKVQDNGIGREASRQLKQDKRRANPSRGISVTEQRLATLKEKYGWQITMNYEDLVHANGEPAGTCVTLNVPVSSM